MRLCCGCGSCRLLHHLLSAAWTRTGVRRYGGILQGEYARVPYIQGQCHGLQVRVVNLGLAFVAGLLSFVSLCVLPLLPACLR